jgi:hypothetical protein
MNDERRRQHDEGLAQLPDLHYPSSGRNGEDLSTDEAAVWKRVLNYRVAAYLRPKRILETHPGLGISTTLYKRASPTSEFVTLNCAVKMLPTTIDLIDVDPFGSPWRFVDCARQLIGTRSVIQISNGEAHAVVRNLRRGQEYPTHNFGRRLPRWVTLEYLPQLQDILKMKVQFFYAFPTTIRVILSGRRLPNKLWSGCPQWMWWLSKYAPTLR